MENHHLSHLVTLGHLSPPLRPLAMADASRVRIHAQGVSRSILEQSERDLTNLRIGKQRLVSKKKRLSGSENGWRMSGEWLENMENMGWKDGEDFLEWVEWVFVLEGS